ncbi:MAG: preprotein translocase subunit SecA, partial [Bacteroidales bacterium]|nr:preprotein translocase subunit SecA [Bacteroidales bacterium]
MSIITKILGLFLGNKYERDIKEITPFVEKIHREYELLKNLSNDQLRQKSDELRAGIHEDLKEDEAEIAALRAKAEAEEDVYLKEELYNEVDKLDKQLEKKLESVLDRYLPLAFAIVKDTARRFKENSELEVTARQYDRDLAAKRPSVKIKGDKAYWSNRWTAGGNEII